MSLFTTELTTALFEPFEEVISNMGCSSNVVEVTKTSEELLEPVNRQCQSQTDILVCPPDDKDGIFKLP